MDELEHRIARLKPDIVVLTETWLHVDIPDVSISLPDFSIVRKDRNNHGGGIIFYISHKYQYHVIDLAPIVSVSECESEISSVFFPSVKLLMIAIYHPFWKNSNRNESAISCILDIIDHVMMTSNFDQSCNIILCGDFNDLVCDIDDIENCTGLKRLVVDNTRGNRILDQIFTNICSNSVPLVSAPIGLSDHAVVMWHPVSERSPVTTKKIIRVFSEANKRSFVTTLF